MSDRGRAVVIFGAVALVAAGAGFYFFKIHQPAQRLEEARAEIATWEARYQDARDCLLGKTPGSSKTSEALAIREMTPDPWERGKCTPLVSKLSRGITNDTGVEPVEAAWTELDQAARTAALAFAKHVASSTTLADDPLPKGLDELDAARDKLRTAAKLPATTQTGTPLAPAQIIDLVDGKEPVTEVIVNTLPSAHGFVSFGKTASREVQIVIETGGAAKVGRVGPGSMRAVPDPSWGATAGPLVLETKKPRTGAGELAAGAMDVEGVIASPATLAIKTPVPPAGNMFAGDELAAGDRIGTVTLAAVAGTPAEGVVVYGAYQRLVVARGKAGAFTAGTPIEIDVATASADLDGRVAVVWSTPAKVHKALLVTTSGEEAFELPDSFQGAPCLTKDRIWVMGSSNELFAFGGGKPLARLPVPPYSGLQGCTTNAAIVRKRSKAREVAICTNECRTVMMPSGAPDLATVTEVGGKLRAIAAHGGVVGVWSEDKPPVFYALPMQAKPVLSQEWPAMAMSSGKTIDVIARGAKTFVVVRIPAP
jgi:hypothetical protein